MLVLSSVNATDDLGKGRGRLHEITSQQAAMAPLTAFSRTVRRAEDMPAAYADAYRIFEAGRPRPVHIELPLDLLAAPGPRLGERAAIATPPAPAPDLIAKAASLIAGARRPVILAGGGMVDHGGVVKALAEKIGAAVIPTVAAKGAVPDSHPLCLGSTLSLPPTQELLRSADVVIAVGTELAETDSWIDRLPITGKLIRIDIDPATLTRDYPPEIAILADGATALTALLAAMPSGSRSQIDRAELARIRDGILPSLPPLQRKHARVLDAVRAALPADGMVASDMTQIAYTGCYYFRSERPRCWFHPLGYGTLGYALPAAIGAKIACPEKPVVALAGEGHGRAGGRCRPALHRAGAGHRGRAEVAHRHRALEQRCPRADCRGHGRERHSRDRRAPAQPGLHQARQGLRLPHRETDEPRPLQGRARDRLCRRRAYADRGARGRDVPGVRSHTRPQS
jgi:5-guanidino-2-oxopentanoate decarboxylase